MTAPNEPFTEPDDTQGHLSRAYAADAETIEGDDDVSGHVQPPPDWQHLDR